MGITKPHNTHAHSESKSIFLWPDFVLLICPLKQTRGKSVTWNVKWNKRCFPSLTCEISMSVYIHLRRSMPVHRKVNALFLFWQFWQVPLAVLGCIHAVCVFYNKQHFAHHRPGYWSELAAYIVFPATSVLYQSTVEPWILVRVLLVPLMCVSDCITLDVRFTLLFQLCTST